MKAFPTTAQTWDIHNGRDLSGMDLRDYFAAVALQGTLSNPYIADNSPMDRNQLSAYAYELADAMMKARKIKND